MLLLLYQHYQREVENHQAIKERLDEIASQLEKGANGNAEDILESQARLDDNWSELCALLEDREEDLLGAQTDLLLVRCLDDVDQLEEWFKNAMDTMEKPVLVLGSATFGKAKEQLGRYKVSWGVGAGDGWALTCPAVKGQCHAVSYPFQSFFASIEFQK